MNEKKHMAALKASLERSGSAVLGRRVVLHWIIEGDDMGYTMIGTGDRVDIYVAWDHPLWEGLSEARKDMARTGTFVHEVLHQCWTDFIGTNALCKALPQAEAAVFMQFANTLEDPAIEYLAPKTFGGYMLDALRFNIALVYKRSPGITKCRSAFSQLMAALIYFGDLGVVKGHFTFPEAKKYFFMVAPKYNEGILCPDSYHRLEIAKECMDICRPLWEETVKEKEELRKLIDELIEFLKREGVHAMKGREESESRKASERAAKGKEDSSKAAQNRAKAVEKIQAALKKAAEEEKAKAGNGKDDPKGKSEPGDGGKEDGDKKEKGDKPESGKNPASGAELPEDADIEFIPMPDDDGDDDSSVSIEVEMPTGNGSSEKKDSGKEGTDSGDMGENGEAHTQSNAGKASDDRKGPETDPSNSEDGSDEEAAKPSPENGSGASGGTIDYSDLDETGVTEDDQNVTDEETDEVYPITDEMLANVQKEIEEEMKAEDKRERESEADGKEFELPDYDISSAAFNRASCLNQRVVSGESPEYLHSLYSTIVNENAGQIRILTKRLDTIFKSDCEENIPATSGKYNIMRGSIGTTARIFDKKRDPENLKDAAVVLCVDLSGSMGGYKVREAKRTSVIFAEALTALKIPYYIMGFSADTGADAVHQHYVTWTDKKSERETLAVMKASGNNFDGYSIRYAARLLKDKAASNKLLFVISDGQPVCSRYGYFNAACGIADTVNAIKDSRKVATTFGIAIGRGCKPETLQSMYGKDFICVEEASNLANTLGKKLQKLLAKQN